MYNLGEQFLVDYSKAAANPASIIKGNKFRITVLTDSLVRLEYNNEGVFLDSPTELVWYRNFPKPNFEIKEDSNYLEIKTKYFKLTYAKERDFNGGRLNPSANLKIDLLNTDRFWYYNHPEARNLLTAADSLTEDNGKIKMRKGLYSADGFVSLDDSKGDILEPNGALKKRETKGIDIYVFFYLNDFSKCLNDYYLITGYPALIPRYALGNWWSRNMNYNDEEIKKLVEDFNYYEIPLSVFLLNRDWHIHNYNNKDLNTGFTFNKENVHEPDKVVEYLHSKGIRIGLDIDPMEGFYPFEQYYEQAKKYLQTDSKGIIPFSVLDPKTVDVYLKLFIHPLDALGIDFYFLDTKLNEKLWLLDHYQFTDMKRNYKRRPMILTANAGVAVHRYPVLYSGKSIVSWDTLKRIPLHNSSAANMGVSFWSHDIGGFYKGIEDNELYTRYVQLGTFSPILKFGAEKGKYYKREPWRWSVKTYKIVKDYLNLRHRLIPYLYTEAYKYHKFGIPIIKPLYYQAKEMYDDPIYRNEYYFGSELFVSPIITKKDYVMNRVVHRFFMPEGTWYDFVTGKKFPGGREYISFFKDEDYPVFAKAGSIVVLGDNENKNDTTPPKDMEIHIFPGRSNLYKLYEDDGVSDLYRKGFYLLSSIDYNYLPNNYTVIIRALEGKSGIVPATRNYKIRFRNTREANDVIVYFNNDPIPFVKYVDGTDFIVDVKDVSTIGQLTINCKGKDIEIDATRLINEDIESIISDLELDTEMKEKIDAIIFGNMTVKKKRIAIRKLKMEKKFIRLFLRLLEYIEQI